MTTAIENTTGPMNRESLVTIGWVHETIDAAEKAAQQAVADGYDRVVIQTVGASRLSEGRSMDEDDHWVAAPGHEYFVWGDLATHQAKQAAVQKEIEARDARENASKQERFSELLALFAASPVVHIMTGTRFQEDLRDKGLGELSAAASAARKVEDLRQIVADRNASLRSKSK